MKVSPRKKLSRGNRERPLAHVIVVGGTRGVGLACTTALAESWHRVTTFSRRGNVAGLASGENVDHVQVDLTNGRSILGALKKATRANGPIDAIVLFQRFRGTDDPWRGELKVSLDATKGVIEHATEFISPHGASIVIASSNAARSVAPDQGVGYHVARAGLEQMARYYAASLGHRGVRVNCVAFGALVKPGAEEFYRKEKALREDLAQLSVLGRMGTARDIAQTVRFLAGPESSYITGQTVIVDGGASLLVPEALMRKVATRKK